MQFTGSESVDDPRDLLRQHDHMRGMERIEMVVEAIVRPFPSVTRVTGRIAPSDPAAWRRPNLAVRLEVESPAGERPVSRVYTVRSFDEGRSLIDIDFVMHPDDSPAMRWLRGARVGAAAWLTGPRAHFVPHYAAGRPVAVFADETAIPAVYAILRRWQAGTPGVVHVETADAAACAELPRVAGVEHRLWLRGPDEAPGTTGRLLAAAQSLPAPGTWTVWAAGERREVRAIRACFEELGLDKEDVRVFGYWRRGVSSSEVDRARLRHYEDVRAQGGGLAQLEDSDGPV